MNLAGFGDFVLPFLMLLGVLIFIHELGHFMVAKWFGVKCERFSMGFGPTLLSRQVGETEYVLAALPLGGYVKMLGEIPGEELSEEERERAFNHKPVYQRIAIALAGPVMNLVLPVFLIGGMLMAGIPTLTSSIGAVAPDSVAERAGIVATDRIVAIDGLEIWRWSDLTTALRATASPSVQLVVEREGGRIDVDVVREKVEGGAFGPLGVEPSAPSPVFGVPDPESPAGRAGLRTGDLVIEVNGEPTKHRYAVERALAQVEGPLELEIERALDEVTETLRVRLEGQGGWSLEQLGLIPIDFAVSFVDPASPARKAGLLAGDIFLSVGGEPVNGWEKLVETIRGSEGAAVAVVVLRKGREIDLEVRPMERAVQVEGGTETHFAIGIGGGTPRLGGELRDDVVRNPLVALWRGTTRTVEIFSMIIGGIVQLFSGTVGLNNLAGPIGIGEIAADSFSVSWIQFFSFMAVISVNLAILNLLPIPILDGGQIVLAAAEGIKGSPLPLRAREIAQTVGLSLILVLMGFAFWNDISRNWGDIVGFLKGLV